MTNFKMMITPEGKHPASKWAEIAADEILEISDNAPETKVREAKEFREKLVSSLTLHHQNMMDHEQSELSAGLTDPNLPYKTEDYAADVVDEIIDLAQGYSFSEHFEQPETHAYLTEVCNRNFKSAKLVERSHFNAEQPAIASKTTPRSKKS